MVEMVNSRGVAPIEWRPEQLRLAVAALSSRRTSKWSPFQTSMIGASRRPLRPYEMASSSVLNRVNSDRCVWPASFLKQME